MVYLMILWNGRNEEVLYFGYRANGNDGNDGKRSSTPCSYRKDDFQNLQRSFTDRIDKIKQSVYAPYFTDDLLKLLSDLELTGLFYNLKLYMVIYKSAFGININDIKKDIDEMRYFADRIGVYTGNKCDFVRGFWHDGGHHARPLISINN